MDVTQFSAQNNRSYQEDRSFFTKTNKDQLLLGVFDGHGGSWVSEIAVESTPAIFRATRKTIKQDPEATLNHIYSKLVKATTGHHSGSTASIVWLKDNVAHVAVLGDSPVVIKDANGEIWKSPEHNVRTNLAEAQAAEARDGKISANGYLFDRWRIDGPGLQMSRALGDKELDRVLNREPEIFHIPVNKDSWILVCSDGLLDPSHIADDTLPIVVDFIDHGADAEELVLAMANIQRDDNSTAVLVRLS
jgi:serine/threonine protein phosphatase PrpC